MRSSALFTVVFAGATAVASAQPRQEETSGRVGHKEKAPQRPAEWIEIASPTPASHGTEFVVVGGADAGYFSQLRIDAQKGRTIVRKVKVYFTDGTIKTKRVDRTIRGDKFVQIDLGEAKAIDRVAITTDTHTDGQYVVWASAPGPMDLREAAR